MWSLSEVVAGYGMREAAGKEREKRGGEGGRRKGTTERTGEGEGGKSHEGRRAKGAAQNQVEEGQQPHPEAREREQYKGDLTQQPTACMPPRGGGWGERERNYAQSREKVSEIKTKGL